MKDITSFTAWELKEKLDNNELTAEEITNEYADRIKEKEPEVQAFVTTTIESAIQKSKEIDKNREKGTLEGIPVL